MFALNDYVKIFEQAVDNVLAIYYGSEGSEEAKRLFDSSSEGRSDLKALTRFLKRYEERKFCYELYHQLRTLTDKHVGSKHQQVLWQGELKKRFIGNLLNYFPKASDALKTAYVPDFLLHSPNAGDFSHQLLVVEVKTDPHITVSAIRTDLDKLQEFMDSYGFEHGIFLLVNTPIAHLDSILRSPTFQNWMRTGLRSENGSRISFIYKATYNARLFVSSLESIRDGDFDLAT